MREPVKSAHRNGHSGLHALVPQDLEMEEAILGAIILERGALPAVIEFLRPEHFYSKPHQEIYQAATTLHRAAAPVDMRTLVAQLRKDEKLDFVGGAYRIAELSSKVSSAANITYHARILAQFYMKREAIRVGHFLVAAGEDNGADPFEIWSKAQAELVDVYHRAVRSSGSEQFLKDRWEDYLLSKEPPAEDPLVKLGEVTVATAGNHSLVIGKKKSRKSLFILWLLSQLVNGDPASNAMVFDTEQGRTHVWRSIVRLRKSTGQTIRVFCLRGRTPMERQQIITAAIAGAKPKPKLIVIDGIRDLISNINDPDQTTQVIAWLETITVETGIHVVNVLHQNKNDLQARGHLGTELVNKAETTIELELDQQAGCTLVKCESSRDIPFENFAFTHDRDGLPELVNIPTRKGQTPLSSSEEHQRIRAAFDGQLLGHSDLTEAVKAQFGIGRDKAHQLIARFNREGVIAKNGADRTPGTVYKLMI